jgi:hypothetical protein
MTVVSGALLTPPPTRQQTPVLRPISSLPPFLAAPCSNDRAWRIPTWAELALQIPVSMGLYLFAFWLAIEFIKFNGDIVFATIDYLAFQP